MKALKIIFFALLALIAGIVIFYLVTHRHPFESDFWAKVSDNLLIGILCMIPFLVVIVIGLYQWFKNSVLKKK